ncbi:uncharacterized protein LOC113333107 [Papaver somniferum]|uniref:uncharacterized protein LOC113333107 n=1 Tax=Papaver somniferum TaxID=3469 RepID=UPI000E702BCD|nr:uncharacterized protein LOC113333107 [Papaver somniferum]
MRILSWNVQGIGIPITRDHLNNLYNDFKSDIVFLSETKAPFEKMDLILKTSKFFDWFIIPSVGIAKGLAIAWHNNVELRLVSAQFNVCHFEGSWHNNVELRLVSAQFNVCHFEGSYDDKVFELTCIYGAVGAEEKIIQWSHIQNLANQVQKPWALIGDLNIILDPAEKQGGNNTSSSNKTIVRQIIDSLGLQDAGYEGAPFTWSNNRSGDANICERIDRTLTSYQWIQLFPNTKD